MGPGRVYGVRQRRERPCFREVPENWLRPRIFEAPLRLEDLFRADSKVNSKRATDQLKRFAVFPNRLEACEPSGVRGRVGSGLELLSLATPPSSGGKPRAE